MFALNSAYTVWGLIISLLPPFYPREAELRGANPAQYGFVFGAANLAAFVAACLVVFGATFSLRVLAGQLHAHRHVDAAEEELELGAAANQK